MQSAALREIIREYNWDDGFLLPQSVRNAPACDLALALEIFYLADGYSFLSQNMEGGALPEWDAFIRPLYEEILQGKYPETGAAFSVPLNRAARDRSRKSGVPEVFLTDLPSAERERKKL